MNSMMHPAPRAPSDTARASRLAVASQPIARAAFAHFVAASGRLAVRNAAEVAEKLWPSDASTVTVIERAVANVTDTAGQTALLQQSVGGFLQSNPLSAASQLFAQSTEVSLEGGEVLLPAPAAVPPAAPWVAENEAIPIQEGTIDAVQLGPLHKAAVIVTASRELVRRAGAVEIFEILLREQAAITLDAAVFNDDAAGADRPAGLLHGVTPIDTGALSGPVEVLAALAGALGQAGGSGRVVIVTTPALAMATQLHLPHLAWPILPSLAIAPGTVVAIDPAALAFAAGRDIDIMTSKAGVLHMSSTPSQIGVVGDPNVTPMRELWQTGALATRLIIDMAFAMRAPGRVHIAEGQAW